MIISFHTFDFPSFVIVFLIYASFILFFRQSNISILSVGGMKGLLLEICKQNPSVVLDVLAVLSKETKADVQKKRNQNSPSWCTCSHCTDMPRENERVCCKQIPKNCFSRLPVRYLDNIFLATSCYLLMKFGNLEKHKTVI